MWTLLVMLMLLAAPAWGASTLTVTPTAVVPGATVTMTVRNVPTAVVVGDLLYVLNDQGVSVGWVYVDGTKIWPGPYAVDTATFAMAMPVTPGVYTFRYVPAKGTPYVVGPAVTVGPVVPPPPPPPPAPPVIVPTMGLAPLQSITVTVANGPATPLDWVGLFAVGAANDKWLEWFRLNGTHTATIGVSAGGATFKLPSTGGPFEVRFFKGTGYGEKLLTSPPFGGTVTFDVTAPSGFVFTGWTGSDPRCATGAFVLNADLTCSATFGVLR